MRYYFLEGAGTRDGFPRNLGSSGSWGTSGLARSRRRIRGPACLGQLHNAEDDLNTNLII